jgi:radical SAM-linked protein
VQDRLRLSGIQVKWQNPEVSALEGLWSRGDRKLSLLLETAYRTGCRLDGWSDQFRFDLWGKAMDQTGIDLRAYTSRQRGFDELLPWDHIDIGVKKSFLKLEWDKATRGELTEDCRAGHCQGCGVCDFKTLKPTVADLESSESIAFWDKKPEAPVGEKVFAISYSRLGEAAYFGHLELVNIFLRAIRRARIHIKFSQGYHPMPKAAFHDPLPVGMESVQETFYLTVLGAMDSAVIQERLNQQLPEGLTVLHCVEAAGNNRGEQEKTRCYFVQLKEGYGFFDEKRLNFFNQSQHMIIDKKSSKGKINSIDLKLAVQQIKIEGPVEIRLVLVNEPGLNVRPAEAIEAIFSLTPAQVKQARVVKLPSESVDSFHIANPKF